MGAIVKSLEGEWGVNVRSVSMERLVKLAFLKGKKFLVGAGVSSRVQLCRVGYGRGMPRYFMLPRKMAGAVARCRVGYGPDRVSLGRRGVGGGLEMLCRWGCEVDGDADHLLLRCPELGFVTHALWHLNSIEYVFGDKVPLESWDSVGKVLRDVCEKCAEVDE